MVTVLADVASASQPVDEVRSFTTPAGTVLRVMPPSSESLSHGFGFGPFVTPPLDVVQYENVSVQVISWTEKFFDQRDTSNEMITINFRKGKENMAPMDLDPPLLLTLGVGEAKLRPVEHDFGELEQEGIASYSRELDPGDRGHRYIASCSSHLRGTWIAVSFPVCLSRPFNVWNAKRV